MSGHSVTDAELLEEAHRRPEAFGAFYERHSAALLSFLVRRSGDTEAGADLMAEVFAAALGGLDRFDANRAEPAVLALRDRAAQAGGLSPYRAR